MKNMLKVAGYKIIILIFIILFGIWQSYAYVQEEVEHKHRMLEHEIDLSIYRTNQQVLIESSLMEPIVNNLELLTLNQQSDQMLREALKIHFNRNDYIYSLWLKPDRIINGIDQINPRDIEQNSYKAYGDHTNYVKPFYDQERRALYMPVYRKLSFKDKQEAILFKEVNLSGLIRDLSRLNQKYGGTGLLINDNKELIHLSTAAKISSAKENALMAQIDRFKRVGQETLVQEGEITIIRAIGSSNWYFIYYENNSILLSNNLLRYLLAASFFLVIVYLIYREALNRTQMNQQIQTFHSHLGEDHTQGQIMYWLKAEVEQINRLKSFKGSEDLVRFKYDVMSSLIKEQEVLERIHTREFMKWVKSLRDVSSVLEIEESTDSHGFLVSAGLLNCLISAVLQMLDSKLEGNVIIKFENSTSMIIFTLYGEVSRAIGAIIDQEQSSIKYMTGQEKIHCSNVGNRLIMALQQDRVLNHTRAENIESAELKKTWNGMVYLLEDDAEENLILKFYLDKLNIHLEYCTLLEKLPANSILMMSKRKYEKMESQMVSYEVQQIHFVLYGGSEDLNDNENILITRPYSMDKIQHAFSSFMEFENG